MKSIKKKIKFSKNNSKKYTYKKKGGVKTRQSSGIKLSSEKKFVSYEKPFSGSTKQTSKKQTSKKQTSTKQTSTKKNPITSTIQKTSKFDWKDITAEKTLTNIKKKILEKYPHIFNISDNYEFNKYGSLNSSSFLSYITSYLINKNKTHSDEIHSDDINTIILEDILFLKKNFTLIADEIIREEEKTNRNFRYAGIPQITRTRFEKFLSDIIPHYNTLINLKKFMVFINFYHMNPHQKNKKSKKRLEDLYYNLIFNPYIIRQETLYEKIKNDYKNFNQNI